MENFASGMFQEIRRLGAEGKNKVTRDVIIVTLVRVVSGYDMLGADAGAGPAKPREEEVEEGPAVVQEQPLAAVS